MSHSSAVNSRRALNWFAAGGLFFALAACKQKAAEAPAYRAPPPATAPAFDKHIDERVRKIIADMQPVPPLGDARWVLEPDGQTWSVYPSGIRTQDLLPTDGLRVAWGQMVTIAYREMLPAIGTHPEKIMKQQNADSPWTFRQGDKSVIKGLLMGISTMKAGMKRRIWVPAELAYGDRGDPENGIGPGQPLVFEVELISVAGDALPEMPSSELPDVAPLGPPNPAASKPATGPS